MTRAILSTLLLTLMSALGAAEGRSVLARHLITVADDFIVDVYHNGRNVPDSKRTLILERFGATVEKIDVEVRDGDWLVFNVVNNRLRWGGAYYFAVAGCLATNEFGFVSRLDTSDWSACDDLSRVDRFIAERTYLQHRRADVITRPWHEGTKLMRQHAGANWDGTPLWGARKNTWIKVLVGGALAVSTPPSAEAELITLLEGTSWSTSPESQRPFLTFLPDGVVQGSSATIRGRWYAISDRTVIAEWKRQMYVITFEDGIDTARLYRNGEDLTIKRTHPSPRSAIDPPGRRRQF